MHEWSNPVWSAKNSSVVKLWNGDRTGGGPRLEVDPGWRCLVGFSIATGMSRYRVSFSVSFRVAKVRASVTFTSSEVNKNRKKKEKKKLC